MPDGKRLSFAEKLRIKILFTSHGARTGAFSRLDIDGPKKLESSIKGTRNEYCSSIRLSFQKYVDRRESQEYAPRPLQNR